MLNVDRLSAPARDLFAASAAGPDVFWEHAARRLDAGDQPGAVAAWLADLAGFVAAQTGVPAGDPRRAAAVAFVREVVAQVAESRRPRLRLVAF